MIARDRAGLLALPFNDLSDQFKDADIAFQ